MKSISGIIAEIIRVEGGYSNDPNDAGGETKYGITVATARSYGYMGKMVDLPTDVARAIYQGRYVTAPGFDKVAAVSMAVAAEMVDTGVNMGVSIPGPLLQRWLNAFNKQQALYADLVVDGQLGPKTIQALSAFLKVRGKEGEAVLVRALNCSQGARYLELTEKREKNEDFAYGWLLNRVVI